MSDRWKMNRIGFVNFWLYDEEDFEFVDGKLLLRGQNGSGKSITMKGVMGILPKNGKVVEGSVMFQGNDLTKYSERQMQQVRGSEIAMIFQDPMTSLNPTMKVGKQIEEMLKEHRKEMSKADRKTRAIELLSLVGNLQSGGTLRPVSTPAVRWYETASCHRHCTGL